MTSLYELVEISSVYIKIIFSCVTKQAVFMWRSTVLSPPFKLVFLGKMLSLTVNIDDLLDVIIGVVDLETA